MFTEFTQFIGGISIGAITSPILAGLLAIPITIAITRQKDEIKICLFPASQLLTLIGFTPHPLFTILYAIMFITNTMNPDTLEKITIKALNIARPILPRRTQKAISGYLNAPPTTIKKPNYVKDKSGNEYIKENGVWKRIKAIFIGGKRIK